MLSDVKQIRFRSYRLPPWIRQWQTVALKRYLTTLLTSLCELLIHILFSDCQCKVYMVCFIFPIRETTSLFGLTSITIASREPVCTISLRFRFRYFSQIQIWILAIIKSQCPILVDTGNLIMASVQPGNAVNIQTICYCFHSGI